MNKDQCFFCQACHFVGVNKMVSIPIQIQTAGLDVKLGGVLRALKDDHSIPLRAAAQSTATFLAAYHRQMDWRGSGWFPGTDNGKFQRSIAEAWSASGSIQSGGPNIIIIRNNAIGLRQKIEGGEIRAKRASALTIPLTKESRHRRVAVYRREVSPLFRPRGKDYLARSVDGRLEVVYLLRKMVRQRPWPGAMPDGDDLSRIASAGFVDGLRGILAVYLAGR